MPESDSPDQSVDSQRLEAWAVRQLADYDARNPGSLFGEGVVLSVAEAYALQAEVARLRCRRGEKIVGYKVGCTSPTVREQLGIDHCVTGRLYDSEQHASGVTLSRRDFAGLAIEGELAVELSREPAEEDFAAEGIPACVARVFPVVELHNLVMRGEQPTAGELIANNAIHAGVVGGSGRAPEDVSDEPSLVIYQDGQVLGECSGDVLIVTIASSLKWLARVVRERGDHLCGGQIILTGSVPSLFPIRDDGRVRVEAPPFGSVDVEFTA